MDVLIRSKTQIEPSHVDTINKKNIFHITNGDGAANIIALSTIMGDILPWRDVLHDGPVPSGLSLAELAKVRARFLAAPAFGGFDKVYQQFVKRDAILQSCLNYDEIVLWFEHDLYDQLQLLQILDWFSKEDLSNISLSMICINAFDGVNPFYGLGQLSPEQMASLFPRRQRITSNQLDLSKRLWKSFRSPSPTLLEAEIKNDISSLPFMKSALLRFLEEYPSYQEGINRSEKQILTMIDQGISKPGKLFANHQKLEESPFLGDWGFWLKISALANCKHPLIKCHPHGEFRLYNGIKPDKPFLDQQLSLSPHGHAVLAGSEDNIMLNGIDRWLGGVHLYKTNEVWRWNSTLGKLQNKK
ncbi:MAG: hypothetical protein HQL69_18825 [Magnetococcales bacterium]|nr:hypothetical protein [Magnetococcales bacterium]